MDENLGKYYDLRLLGGWLALDFANTVENRHVGRGVDALENYADLVRWSYHVGILVENQANHLINYANTERDQAIKAIKQARSLRDVIYELFSLAANGKPFVLTSLNAHVEKLPPRIVRPSGDHYHLAWEAPNRRLETTLWSITISAAELVTSPQLKLVRQCAGCGWLFVDTSRKHNRRWCSMDVCGGRAKSRRQYERVRES